MTSGRRTSPDQLRAGLKPWLGRVYGADFELANVTAPGGTGFSSETLLFDIVAGSSLRTVDRCVIRFANPPANSLFLDPDLARQYRVLQALEGFEQIPTPAPLLLEPDPSAVGAPYLITRRIVGRAPPQVPNYNARGWVAELSPAERNALWRRAITAMAAIHAINPRPAFSFLYEPGFPGDGLGGLIAHARRWFEWVRDGREHRLVAQALDQLDRTRPRDAPDSLLWGDASITNMLFDGGRPTAILDWEIAALGPAQADLAWWLYFQDLMSTGLGQPLLDGIPGRDETITIYEAARGANVRDMTYYELLSTTRNAIMSMRSVIRQIEQGAIPATSRAATDNPSAVRLAHQLGETPPAIGADFRDYVAAASRDRGR